MLNEKDKKQLAERGITEETILKQTDQLRTGATFACLAAPATPENGIIVTTEKTRSYYLNLYDHYSRDRDISKFVPASGAASRMFKDLYACLEAMKSTGESEIPTDFPKVKMLMEHLSELALYSELEAYCTEKNLSIKKLADDKKYAVIIELILTEHGLNYGNLPKALLNFHNYGVFQRKAIDEHLVEGALYASNENGTVNIHFTISPEHEELFQNHIKSIVPFYEDKFGLTYNITWSFQHQSTDTPAVDFEGNLFRDHGGSIVFRPGGHGALIKNLNELNSDLIFIKNIDNVTTDKHRALTVEYKKVLAGILVEKEITINGNLSILMDDNCSVDDIRNISEFVQKDMLFSIPDDFDRMDIEKQRRVLINKLNRPIRVCGMVKNEGEPGGGPFFIRNSKGITSLQIVEGVQVDINNPEQAEILNQSTHFNPVDIVAGIIDFLGRKFDLNEFVDHDTFMIAEKSLDGKPLKALELPGLWNGGMAGWITYFVEVPLETFTPVKEIYDLLRPSHLI
jgi:hypothetical protein